MTGQRSTEIPSQPLDIQAPHDLVGNAVELTRRELTAKVKAPFVLVLGTRLLSSYARQLLLDRTRGCSAELEAVNTALVTELGGPLARSRSRSAQASAPLAERVRTLIEDGAVIVPLPLRSVGADISLGRSSASDIPLKHPSISRMHVAFRYDARQRLFLSDLDSKNGCLVDGRASHETVELHGGEQLTLGKIDGLLLSPNVLARAIGRATD